MSVCSRVYMERRRWGTVSTLLKSAHHGEFQEKEKTPVLNYVFSCRKKLFFRRKIENFGLFQNCEKKDQM